MLINLRSCMKGGRVEDGTCKVFRQCRNTAIGLDSTASQRNTHNVFKLFSAFPCRTRICRPPDLGFHACKEFRQQVKKACFNRGFKKHKNTAPGVYGGRLARGASARSPAVK